MVRERAREIAMSSDSLSPASMFSFMNIWKSLKGDDEGKSLYLSSIDKGALKRLFKGEVEADVFIEILNLCNKFLPTSEKRALEIVYAISNCSNFDMNIMFCNEADKLLIKDYVGRIMANERRSKHKGKRPEANFENREVKIWENVKKSACHFLPPLTFKTKYFVSHYSRLKLICKK